MLGAIYGDIVGSYFEWHNTGDYTFKIIKKNSRFTDDTILTIATMDAILHPFIGFNVAYKYHYRKYVGSNRGFGARFNEWGISENLAPYHSFGNGAGMRVSPVGFVGRNVDEVLRFAKLSASATHNHPEGIKGAQAIALATYYARLRLDKSFIINEIETRFGYDLNLNIEDIQKIGFDETCQVTVPIAIFAFFVGESFEDVIRTAIICKGDSDTIACMAGGIAEAYYGIDEKIKNFVYDFIDSDQKSILEQFYNKFHLSMF